MASLWANVCSFATVLFLLYISVPAERSKPQGMTTSELRAQQAMDGLIHYYWKGDPSHKNVKFFFTCAQLGMVGTSHPGQCSCYNPTSCVNCFRWWSAVALESIATYGIYMNTTNYSSIPDVFYKHSPYNANWNATESCTYIDDFLWYGIAYLRVYDWLGVSADAMMHTLGIFSYECVCVHVHLSALLNQQWSYYCPSYLL